MAAGSTASLQGAERCLAQDVNPGQMRPVAQDGARVTEVPLHQPWPWGSSGACWKWSLNITSSPSPAASVQGRWNKSGSPVLLSPLSLPAAHMCPPPTTPSPLHGDVVAGWPLSGRWHKRGWPLGVVKINVAVMLKLMSSCPTPVPDQGGRTHQVTRPVRVHPARL